MSKDTRSLYCCILFKVLTSIPFNHTLHHFYAFTAFTHFTLHLFCTYIYIAPRRGIFSRPLWKLGFQFYFLNRSLRPHLNNIMHAEFHAQFVSISRLTHNLRHEEYGFALIPHSQKLKTGVPPAEEKLCRRKLRKQSELRGKCHMNSEILNLDDRGPV